MKNKKGFTLIELLAVIAILAILMLMVTPNILSMFNSGKKQAFVTQIQSVWKSAEQEYMNNTIKGQNDTYYSQSVSGSTSKPITLITDTNIDYYVKLKGDGTVDYVVVKDNDYCYKSNSLNIQLTDELESNLDDSKGQVIKYTSENGATCGNE